MNISRIFIERPVMTTLLMAALVIFGVFGYFSLPVSELPNVDFPTIQVSASLPGADPDTMASGVATPLENQFSTIAGIDNDDLVIAPGLHQHHHPVHARPQHRRRRPGRAGGDFGRAAPAAALDAAAADLPQGEPGRLPDHVHFHVVGHDLPHRAGRICRDPAGAPALDPQWRRPGQRLRQFANMRCASRPIPTRSPRARSASTRCPPRSPPPTSTRPPAR